MLWGSQTPRVRLAPEYSYSDGYDAIELAESAGLFLDPWQQDAVIDTLAHDDNSIAEKWASFEVAYLVARQNGKGSILECLELAGLFLLGERLIIHTAHEFKTAAEAYLRVSTLVKNTPSLDKKVKGYHGSHGEEGITLKNGQRLRFLARSKGSGRGFTCDRLIYDEAYELPRSSVAASLPTMSARPNPQLIYASSAPLDSSEVLKGVRDRGHGKQGTSAKRLLYIEFSADPKGYDLDDEGKRIPLDLDDPRGLAAANPGMGRRTSEEFAESERAAMGDIEYARERLGVVDDAEVNAILKPEKWETLRDPRSTLLDPVSFAFDTNPERTWSTVSVAGRRTDGRIHTEVVERQRGTGWLVDRLVELTDDWEPANLLVDAMSPAASLIPQLAERGVEVTTTNTQQYGRACGNYFDLYDQNRLRHTGQAPLTAASEIATKRILGDTGLWGWARRDSTDITPLVSSTLAVYGHDLALAEPDEEEVDSTVVVFRR